MRLFVTDDVLVSPIFSDSRYPGAWRMTCFRNGWSVSTWQDEDTRQWVTETKDAEKELVDWRTFARSVQQAKRNHERAIDLVVKDS